MLTQAEKEAFQSLHKFVKSENNIMFCGMYIVLVNGKLAENAAMNPFPHFFLYNQRNFLSIALLASTCWREHRDINAFFCLKTVVNQKSVNLEIIIAMYTTLRQSLKKMTCLFKILLTLFSCTTTGRCGRRPSPWTTGSTSSQRSSRKPRFLKCWCWHIMVILECSWRRWTCWN